MDWLRECALQISARLWELQNAYKLDPFGLIITMTLIPPCHLGATRNLDGVEIRGNMLLRTTLKSSRSVFLSTPIITELITLRNPTPS